MILSRFIAGLQILQPYYDKDKYSIGAEHDVVYVYRTDRPLTPEDVGRMVALGWFQPEVHTGDDSFTADHYDPEEAWGTYV